MTEPEKVFEIAREFEQLKISNKQLHAAVIALRNERDELARQLEAERAENRRLQWLNDTKI